jgi:hypothetical protein
MIVSNGVDHPAAGLHAGTLKSLDRGNLRSRFPGSSVYSVTKPAVATMVKGIVLDLGPRADE